jgi:hypothetical protein
MTAIYYAAVVCDGDGCEASVTGKHSYLARDEANARGWDIHSHAEDGRRIDMCPEHRKTQRYTPRSGSISLHEFQRPENLNGGFKDAKCVECGLGQRSKVHA